MSFQNVLGSVCGFLSVSDGGIFTLELNNYSNYIIFGSDLH